MKTGHLKSIAGLGSSAPHVGTVFILVQVSLILACFSMNLICKGVQLVLLSRKPIVTCGVIRMIG